MRTVILVIFFFFSYFDCTWCIEKYSGKIIHKIIRILVLSSFCVLNFMLPARSPNFAEVARITCKVDRLQI